MQQRDLLRRPILRIPLEEGKTLYRLRIEAYKSVNTDKDVQRLYFLSTLLSSPSVLDCGNQGFDTLKIFFEEGGWVAEAETIVFEDV